MAVSNPTLLVGPESTIQNTDNNPRAMDANVYELEPNQAPLCALTSQLASRPATNPKVEWLQDQPMPRITTLSASALSNATAFGVAADIFRVGDVARFSSLGFGLLVTATAAGAITATALGTQVSAASGSTGELYMTGNANAEFGTLNEIKLPQLSSLYNYTQIFRTPVGVSGTEEATTHYGGPERARLRKKFGIEHARKIEAAHFFGTRGITSTTRTEDGIRSQISTNITAVNTGLTEVTFQTALVSAFRYGSDTKVAFCSPTALAAVEGFARGRMQVVNDVAQKFGVQMRRYVSGQGTVDLVSHKDWNDSAVYNGYMIIVDMDAVADRPLRGTRLRPDVQAPDADGFKDEYLTETCIQTIWEARHAVLTGIAIGSN